MTADLLDDLRQAGDLLDHDGRAAAAGLAEVYSRPVAASRGRSTSRRVVLLAAAVVVVVAGIWSLARDDGGFRVTTVDPATDGDEPAEPEPETTPDTEPSESLDSTPPEPGDGEPGDTAGPPSSTVALIPSGGTTGWEAMNRAEIGPAGGARGDYVVVAPAGPKLRPERSVGVRRDAELGPTGGLTPVSGSGLTGFHRSDSGRGRAELVVVPREGSTATLTLWAGQTMSVEELFAIAARFDPEQPLAGQSLGPEWVVHSEEGGGAVHTFNLVEGIEGPERTWLWGSTFTDRASGAEWLVEEPYLGTAVEVRGRPGILIAPSDDAMATVVWAEEPGMVVQLTWGELGASYDDRVRGVLAAAHDLVPADAARWSEFTADVVAWP